MTKKLDKNTVVEMLKEDSWLRSPSGMILGAFQQMGKDIPGNLEVSINIAELEALDYSDSPAIYCFLGSRYRALEKELDYDFKLKIEKEKLEKRGKEYLLDYCGKSSKEIIASLPSKGQNMAENINAASEMLESSTINHYLHFNNNQRTIHNLEKSLELCNNNPNVFKTLIEPEVILYIMPFALDKVERYAREGESGGFVSQDYNFGLYLLKERYLETRKKLGMKVK